MSFNHIRLLFFFIFIGCCLVFQRLPFVLSIKESEEPERYLLVLAYFGVVSCLV